MIEKFENYNPENQKGGNRMAEQENYKKMLRKVIEGTNNHTINTSEEIIRMLISELSTNKSLEKYTHSLVK